MSGSTDPIVLRVVMVVVGAAVFLMGVFLQVRRRETAEFLKAHAWWYSKLDSRSVEGGVRAFGFVMTLFGLAFAII